MRDLAGDGGVWLVQEPDQPGSGRVSVEQQADAVADGVIGHHGYAGECGDFFVGSRAGVYRRDAIRAILFRVAAGDGGVMHQFCAGLSPLEGFYGV